MKKSQKDASLASLGLVYMKYCTALSLLAVIIFPNSQVKKK